MSRQNRSLPGWVFLLFICLLAAGLRFWQLGDEPSGLYRDEAYNGLDAAAVLEGEHALFFPRNNGREPAYIYLTAASIYFFGHSALAVRLAAAVAGTLTTGALYLLARSWFDERTALFAAWLWAISVWPIHLSRIGLRAVLLLPLLCLTFWAGTAAYRATHKQQQRWLWFASGILMGVSLYTYLPSRLVPGIVLILICYLSWRGRFSKIWPGILWGVAGFGLLLLPWLILGISRPEIFLERTGQVSIFHPDINQGDFWGTLWRHTGRTFGLFLWEGDSIIRHNPPGRPLFDIFMAIPFVLGIIWCIRHWQKSQTVAIIIWLAAMLASTIMAEDAPHFLRAVGILPVALILPAIGLSQIATWPRLERLWRILLIVGLCVASTTITIRDYFDNYVRQADTAYLFEAAARDLAESVNHSLNDGSTVWLDARYWEGWPSIQFLSPELADNNLKTEARQSYIFGSTAEIAPPQLEAGLPTVVYAWPHDLADVAAIASKFPAPAKIFPTLGSFARGDLEETAYPLYVAYTITADDLTSTRLAEWHAPDGRIYQLNSAGVETPAAIGPDTLQIDVTLTWTLDLDTLNFENESLSVAKPIMFVHVLDTQTGLLSGQSDGPPANGHWPIDAWKPAQAVVDQRALALSEPFDPQRHHIFVGIYIEGRPEDRLPIFDMNGEFFGDSWQIEQP